MHVYVHVPFCTRRCSYCDFSIAVRREVPSDPYADAIIGEWATWQHHPAWNGAGDVATIYFGGGTPSRLAPDAVARIIDRIAADRSVTRDAEITLEVNPEDVDAGRAQQWRAAGITRISLGSQSFDAGVLHWMHRSHSAAQIPAAVAALRDSGITNLSLDLIFGLPTALGRDWAADLDRALLLEPEHLSLYGLTIEPQTPLARWAARGDAVPVDEDRYATEFLAANAALGAAGYEHYEVSNAAKPGYRSRHNTAYWHRAPYIGLGPSAHSGFGAERQWNLRDWAAYERALAGAGPVVEGREHLSEPQIALEEAYLGLRTCHGVPIHRVPVGTRQGWIGAGWAVEESGRIRLTPEGWLRLDALVAALELVPTPAGS